MPQQVALNVDGLSCSLEELERRIGSDRQVAGYYCTSHTGAKPDEAESG
jgi:hypothetical protein